MRRYGDDFTHGSEWRCGCGCINPEDEARCWHCGADTDGELPDCTEGEEVLSPEKEPFSPIIRRRPPRPRLAAPIKSFGEAHGHSS